MVPVLDGGWQGPLRFHRSASWLSLGVEPLAVVHSSDFTGRVEA